MSKVTCSLCGQTFPDYFKNCPICGKTAKSNPNDIKDVRIAIAYYRQHGTLPEGWQFIPEVVYPVPIIPQLHENLHNQELLALALDEEGHISTQIKFIEAKPAHQFPAIGYRTKTMGLANKLGNLMNSTPHYERYAEDWTVRASYAHAIAIIHYTKPHLIRLEEKANEILRKYRGWVSLPVPAPPVSYPSPY